MRTFEQIANERLKALTWDTTAGMRELRARKKAGAARVRRPAMAALALLLTLMAATALAVGLQMSRRVEIKRIARQCVMDTYGLDEKTLTMFNEHAEEANGVWTVTYHYWTPDQGGVYTVTVDKDGTALAAWSLEGVEGAWGRTEIAEEMARKKRELEEMETRAALVPALDRAASSLTEGEAFEKADTVMRQRYGMTSKALSALARLGRYEGGVWRVEYVCSFWPEGPDKIGTYTICLSDANGSCLSAEWSLEGIPSGASTRETLARAQAYDAQCLEWVAEYVERYNEIEQSGEWPVSPEHQAELDGLMIAMGFDSARYNHVAPGTGDLPLTEARELAYQAIHSEFGVSRESYESSVFAYADLTQEPDGRRWYFWIQNAGELTSWTVYVDAQTGEILDIFNESLAAGNG